MTTPNPRASLAVAVIVAVGALALLVAAPARAQRPDPAAELEAKLGSDFLERADWVLDLDEARRRASDTGRPILGYFTTSGP